MVQIQHIRPYDSAVIALYDVLEYLYEFKRRLDRNGKQEDHIFIQIEKIKWYNGHSRHYDIFKRIKYINELLKEHYETK